MTAGGEAPLPAVAVGQLPAGDHQRRHHQQEDRDRDLHALHRGVQVRADVVDHHVHVRPGEAADELGQGQRHQRPSQRGRRPSRRTRLSHPHLPSGRSCGIIPRPPQIAEAPAHRTRSGSEKPMLPGPPRQPLGDGRPAHVPGVPVVPAPSSSPVTWPRSTTITRTGRLAGLRGGTTASPCPAPQRCTRTTAPAFRPRLPRPGGLRRNGCPGIDLPRA